ncbi:unnamed protein product [Rotaria magnacalcarata]|uniref:ABC transporter domain-containing protein n=2 Tax=Rotaria magnacalcarata TaxID=392030 RepID=A0A816MD73_9BILA|nr:unnamed protein product [Rotaria magnacalcarata]CAF4144943.1 unnamed protein product [Rotaria magnacalcarata]CAF4165230.1 unnamed protein product [Rotaria magnacalcarata]
MNSNIDPHQMVLTSIVSTSPSVETRTHPSELVAKRSMLARRVTGINRMSIPQHASATLTFHNINYVVGSKSASSKECLKYAKLPFFKAREPKQVLFDVSGQFKNGMNAILGPSGCGKSSLLDVLADRKDPRGLSGLVQVDGEPRHPSFRYTVGYVVQEDICSGTLTVRENLCFSINLRIPQEMTITEKNECVNRVIKELGLEACADTRVGTEFIRGISGGEKKRTCIGLDASTASSVMHCLKNLSRQGRTVIFSIHQPRYSIFKIFDTVMFMCKGRCVYHDSAENVVPFFATHGYQCEQYDNPADYALDVLIDISRKPETLVRLNNVYNSTNANALAFSHSQKNLPNDENIEQERQKYKIEAARSVVAEIFYLSQRTLRNSVRNPALALSQTLVSIAIGLLVGLLFYDLKKTIEPGVQNRLGAIFFIIMSQTFSNLTAIEPLIGESALFIHERASGYYRIFTFFIAKLVCDLLPMRVLPAVLFSVISYFMIGLTRTGGQFFIYLLTVFMTSLFGSALCFFIAATIPVFAVALITVILIFVIMMMFTGFLIDLPSIFPWLSWMQWISAFRYASNVLTISEFQGLNFCSSNGTEFCQLTGEEVLAKRELTHVSSWDLWKNFFALTVMTIGLFVLAYIQLIRMKRKK